MNNSPESTAGNFAVKRVYDAPADDDGCRVLVDRLWPRGVSRERAQLDLWLKEVAPSPPLRTEFAHMQERFADFRAAYEAELDGNPAVQTLLEAAGPDALSVRVLKRRVLQLGRAVVRPASWPRNMGR